METDELPVLLQNLKLAARPLRDLHVNVEPLGNRFSDEDANVIMTEIHAKTRQLYIDINAFTKLPHYESAEYIRDELDKFVATLKNLSLNSHLQIKNVNIENVRDQQDQINLILLDIVGQLPEIDDAAPVIPQERPAPIQVEIANHRIRLTHWQTRIGAIDYPAANRVRASLFETFDELVAALPSSSNADSRYIRACHVLRDYLSQDLESISIEALGLSYQLVDKITRRLSHEMGGTQLDEIEHVLAGVGVLLNQFEEWRTYLSELAKTKLDPENGPLLVEQSQKLIAEMEKPGAPVDPAVVRRLREMVEPVVTGIVTADTVAVPLVCSLSNVFSLLSQVAIDHVTNAHGLFEHTALMGTAALLVDFSVHMIRTFFPVLSQFQPLHFILAVADYLNKRYSQWKDATSV